MNIGRVPRLRRVQATVSFGAGDQPRRPGEDAAQARPRAHARLHRPIRRCWDVLSSSWRSSGSAPRTSGSPRSSPSRPAVPRWPRKNVTVGARRRVVVQLPVSLTAARPDPAHGHRHAFGSRRDDAQEQHPRARASRQPSSGCRSRRRSRRASPATAASSTTMSTRRSPGQSASPTTTWATWNERCARCIPSSRASSSTGPPSTMPTGCSRSSAPSSSRRARGR